MDAVPPPLLAAREDDERWMRHAFALADRAEREFDEIPVGAVLVAADGRVIGEGFNRNIAAHDPTAHAEMIALRQAAQIVGHWRLEEVTLYCTLEPCAMCAGAMVLARLPRLVYAATDPKVGADGSIMNILRHEKLNHRVETVGGLLSDEAAEQIRAFFRKLRDEGKRH